MYDALKVFDRLGGVGRLLVGGIALVTIAVVFYLVSSAAPPPGARLHEPHAQAGG